MDRQPNLAITALTRRNDLLAESVLLPFRAAAALTENAYRGLWAANDDRRRSAA